MKGRGTGGQSNGTCRLCGLPKPLIKAHIIPRGLYEPIRESSTDGPAGDAVPHLYKPGRGTKRLPRQSGIYDTQILCADCDGNACIGPFDRYGQGLLLSLDGAGREIRDTKRGLVAKQLSEFNYSMTKLFFMSILWRASITSQSFFDQVRLGPWETELHERLIKRDPGDEHCFSVIPFMYTGLFKEVMMNPSKERHDNITFYRFRYPNGGFLVKVDKQKIPRNIRGAILYCKACCQTSRLNLARRITSRYRRRRQELRAWHFSPCPLLIWSVIRASAEAFFFHQHVLKR